MELGRIRLGDRGEKGQPRKLTNFRLTSASRELLESGVPIYGGTVREWKEEPGHFELYTDSDRLHIIVPPVLSTRSGAPTVPYSQYYEHWNPGGCLRRCDGETELISGKPCMCDSDSRECVVTTRLSVMLPHLAGVGTWGVVTHGWTAAVTLPGTLELLSMMAGENRLVPAILRIEERTVRQPGKAAKKFVVPVIDLPNLTTAALMSGETPQVINPPRAKLPRPALPRADVELPADPSFSNPEQTGPDWGIQPELTELKRAAEPIISPAQHKRLRAIAREHSCPDEEVRRIIHELAGAEIMSTLLPLSIYEAVVSCIRAHKNL